MNYTVLQSAESFTARGTAITSPAASRLPHLSSCLLREGQSSFHHKAQGSCCSAISCFATPLILYVVSTSPGPYTFFSGFFGHCFLLSHLCTFPQPSDCQSRLLDPVHRRHSFAFWNLALPQLKLVLNCCWTFYFALIGLAITTSLSLLLGGHIPLFSAEALPSHLCRQFAQTSHNSSGSEHPNVPVASRSTSEESLLFTCVYLGGALHLPCLLCGSITQLLFSCRIHQGFPRRTTHPLLEREQWPCRPTLEARAWHPRSTLPVFTRHLHLCTSNRCLSVAMMRCAMFPQQQALMAALSTTS